MRPYDVVALRESLLAAVPASTFHWLLGISLPFNRFIIDQLNARLAQFVVRLEHSRSSHPDRHVAHCLGELFNATLYPGTGATPKFPQEEIAFLARVSRQLVIARCASWRRKKCSKSVTGRYRFSTSKRCVRSLPSPTHERYGRAYLPPEHIGNPLAAYRQHDVESIESAYGAVQT
jgi:hypothetical protein